MAASCKKYFLGVVGLFLYLLPCVVGLQHCHEGIPDKKIDTAYLTIVKDVNTTVIVQLVTAECYKCDIQNVSYLEPEQGNCTVLLDTRWKMRVQLIANGSRSLEACSENDLSEFYQAGGRYMVSVRQDFTCSAVNRLNSPEDNNIPIYVALGSFVVAALLWIGMKKFRRSSILFRIKQKLCPSSVDFTDPGPQVKTSSSVVSKGVEQTQYTSGYNLRQRKGRKIISSNHRELTYTTQDLGTPNVNSDVQVELKPKRERLKSLDTFRGISIVLMIFVNYRGGDYWFFRHSKWNGLTVADLVFPWFVWIMGTAMVYSFQSLMRNATPKKWIFWKIFKRSCILFVLGLLINCDGLAAPKMREFRIPGVLQRFAGTYLIIATVHMFFAKPTDPNQYTWWSGVRDIVDYWGEWVVNIIIIIIYLCLTFLLPVPGCPRGYLGPGGLAEGGNYTNCTGGAAGYIDRVIFREAHIYQTPTCKEIYNTTVPHDPEGLLGTLMSCFMCFLGLQAGKILLIYPDWKARVKRFLIWALVLGLLALALCNAKRNDGWIPINKNLWSFTFVLSLSGMAFLLLAFCYVTIDVYKIWTGAPFYYPGMNSIFFYVCHIVLQPYFPIQIYVDPTSHWELLAIHLWGPFFWCAFTYGMHLKKMYISI